MHYVASLTQEQIFELNFKSMATQLRVCLPGTINSFNASNQTASVQPGIKMKIVLPDENDAPKVQYVDLPTIQNCPVVIPAGLGAGLYLTFPIQSGDPCLILFADRALDQFMQTGSNSRPGDSQDDDITIPRSHSLTDAICIPGFITDPKKIQNWNNSAIELRDRNRQNIISLDPNAGITLQTNGKPITITTAGGGRGTDDEGIPIPTATAPVSLIGSNISLDGRPGSSPSAPMTITNGLKSTNGTFIDKNNRDSTAHIHSGVQGGPSNTGPTAG